jgi:hypothetical protein
MPEWKPLWIINSEAQSASVKRAVVVDVPAGCCELVGNLDLVGDGRICSDKTFCPKRIYADAKVYADCPTRLEKLRNRS